MMRGSSERFRRMRVLFASHLFPNRQEPLKGVFVLELARAMARMADVRVLAPLPFFPLLRSYKSVPCRDTKEGLSVYHPRYLALPSRLFGWRWRTYYHQAVMGQLRTLDHAPEVIHAHWVYPDGFAVIRYARERGIKTVLTVHGHAAFGWYGPRHLLPYYKRVLCMADRVIVVSREIQHRLTDGLGVNEERIRVIHNGVDMERFPILNQENARRRLGLPLNKRILLAVARLSPEKGLARLVEQAHRCTGRHDWELHIAGVGPLKADLQEKICSLGLESRVLLEGGIPHEQLHTWYAAADLLCLSSFHEGCPVVVHEALACGLPVVSTRVGAVTDLVQNGQNGLLCSVQEDAEIGAQLDRALRMNWDRERIAAAGRVHTWDQVARQTFGVYQEAVARKDQTSCVA